MRYIIVAKVYKKTKKPKIGSLHKRFEIKLKIAAKMAM